MNKGKLLKNKVNKLYFEIPKGYIKAKLYSLKYHMNTMQIFANQGELFVCNKTSEYDKLFVVNAMKGTYVFLKDEYIQKLYDSSLTLSEEKEIIAEAKKLKDLSISIVIFPEKHVTTFGDFKKMPSFVCDFLLKFEMNMKFVNLIGTYFINPVWAKKSRICDTKIEHKFTFKLSEQKSQDELDNYEKINRYMPSPASVYAKKIPIYLRTNKCAEDLEKILYACPHCMELFTLYSEFNCVKCNNCGTAFEVSNISSEISLTSTFSSLDEAKNFQYDQLKSKNYSNGQKIAFYENLKFKNLSENQNNFTPNTSLTIYTNKIEYQNENGIFAIPFDMIFETYLDFYNTLVVDVFDVNTQTNYKITFNGSNKENFYILVDLFEYYQEKKKQ